MATNDATDELRREMEERFRHLEERTNAQHRETMQKLDRVYQVVVDGDPALEQPGLARSVNALGKRIAALEQRLDRVKWTVAGYMASGGAIAVLVAKALGLA